MAAAARMRIHVQDALESVFTMGWSAQYRDLMEEPQAFLRVVANRSHQQALATAGMQSPTFWLRHVRSKLLRNGHARRHAAVGAS
jgi:hypothetical protein